MLLRPVLLCACTALAACAGTPAPQAAEPTVSVYKSRGGLQCENNALPVADLERQLKDAGIAVSARACGHDGRMRPAMCGRADGNIAIFDIPASKVEAAKALQFGTMDAVKDASRAACP